MGTAMIVPGSPVYKALTAVLGVSPACITRYWLRSDPRYTWHRRKRASRAWKRR